MSLTNDRFPRFDKVILQNFKKYSIIVASLAASAWLGTTSFGAEPTKKFKAILPPVIEAKTQPKTGIKIPLTKPQEKSNIQSKLERQALDAASKGDAATAVKKYAILGKSFAGNKIAGAIDLRILEIHKSHYATNLSPESFQQALIGTSEKYRDENALGPTNKPLTKRILAVVQQMHKSLIMSLIKHAKLKEATSGNRKQTLVALDKYLDSASEAEKEPLRAAKGEIQFLDGNHIASAATFAALAELKGAQAPIYWRLAIRSQQILASWPSEPPWEGTGVGSGANTSAPRETLRSMYASIAKPDDWSSAGQIGLIDLKLNRQAEAFKLFTETLQRNSKGPHAEHAAGLMAFTFLKGKSWQELEDLARVMVKNGLVGAHLKVSYVGNKILGTALLEGGLEKYTGADYKASVTKLDEFVRGWKDHSRHDQAFYQLALAHYSSKSYRLALETMINFTRSYPKTKYRRDALVTGGAWSLSLAWEDHVIYFYESHVREFGLEAQAVTSLETLVNLYMGREFYDAASRVMEIQLSHPLIASETKEDIARRLLDMHERSGSRESALKAADLILKNFGSKGGLAAPALSLKARLAGGQNLSKLEVILRQLKSLDANDRAVVEALSELHFMKAEASAKGAFNREIFSLSSKNPLADLNAAYGRYDRIRAAYETACVQAGASWCGPAMYQLARVSEQFTGSIAPLDIPRTLEPEMVKGFLARKKSIIDTVDAKGLAADDRSLQEANGGSTNPEWTGSILWQNASDWQSERVSGETGNGYIQWHASAN